MSLNKTSNLTEYQFGINKDLRSKRLKQKPKLLWFTGLSGSGKSTIANEIEKKLFIEGFMTYALDGDNIRGGLCSNLTFSAEDRSENIRRIAEVSKILLDAGFIVCASFVSPFSKDREMVQKIVAVRDAVEHPSYLLFFRFLLRFGIWCNSCSHVITRPWCGPLGI